MARLTQDNLGIHKVNLTRNNLWTLEVRHTHIRINLLGSQSNRFFKTSLVSSQGTPLDKLAQFTILQINQPSSKGIPMARVDNPMFNRAHLPLESQTLLGKGGNPLPSLYTKEGSLPCSKPNPLPNPVTVGDKRANHLYSQINPGSTLIVNLDKLANLDVNQLSNQFDHPFREDNPWWHMDNLASSKAILLANQVHHESDQVNLRDVWPNLSRFKDTTLGLRLKQVINPHTKRSLPTRLRMGPSSHMATSNPRGKISMLLTKIISNHRSLPIKIINMVNLAGKLLIHGELGGKHRDSRPHTDKTPTDKIPMRPVLSGQVRLDKVRGGNPNLGGTLIPPRTLSHRCPSNRSYHFWLRWNYPMCPS